MFDFAAEYNKLYNGNNSCSVKNYDWNTPNFLDPDNECHDSEKALAASLTSEAFSNYGFEVDYYIKDISTSRDELMGEDPLENVVRRFRLKVYAESIPTMQKQYQLQGMQYSEIVTLQATIQHFKEASTLDYNTLLEKYEEAIPKIGDIIYLKWCDTYYEVLNVKEFASNDTYFLTEPITYTFNLKAWKNVHESVDINDANDDKMEDLRSYVQLGEVFHTGFETKTSDVKATGDILAVNEELKKDNGDNINSNVKYVNKQSNENNIIDPFNGW